MKCEKCKGDGRMIGGKLKNGETATGWGTCDACDGTGQRTIEVVEPPSIEEVIAAGYTPEAAAAIVAEEQAKAGRGERPYGPNDPTSPWGTPTKTAVPDPPKPEAVNGAIAAALQKFDLGQKVALIAGGPIMTVTSDLGDEVACEWPILDGDGKPAGKESRAFAVASLKPIVE